MTEQPQSLRDKVLDTIHHGGVVMRPRWHFILRSALVALGIVIVALFAVYLASLVVFLMKQSGGWFGAEFGPRGVRALLFSAPWLLIGASLLFIVLLELLARRTEVARRTPMLYSALGVIAVVALGTVIVDRAAVHPFLAERVRYGAVPMMHGMYRYERQENLRRGVISEVFDHSIIIESPDGTQEEIAFLENTRMPQNWTPKVGEVVVVFGEQQEGKFTALGVRPVDPMHFERVRMRGMHRGYPNDELRLPQMRASPEATSADSAPSDI